MVRKLFSSCQMSELTIQQAFDKFQISNKSKGLSDETLKYYHRCVKVFGRFVYRKMLDTLSMSEEKKYKKELCAQQRVINQTGANPVCLRSSQPAVASLAW